MQAAAQREITDEASSRRPCAVISGSQRRMKETQKIETTADSQAELPGFQEAEFMRVLRPDGAGCSQMVSD